MYSESPFSTANIISAGYGDMKQHHLFWSAAGAPVQHICWITFILTDIITDTHTKKNPAIFKVQLLGPTTMSICYNLTEIVFKPADTERADGYMKQRRFHIDKLRLRHEMLTYSGGCLQGRSWCVWLTTSVPLWWMPRVSVCESAARDDSICAC